MKSGNSYIVRFDCNLRRGLERPGFRGTNIRFPEAVYFSPDLALNERNMQELTYANEPERPAEARPTAPTSSAMERVYENYGVYKDQGSEFFSAFRYSAIGGIGKETGVTRRDPSKVIKVGDSYYVWYTRRQTDLTWQGIAQASEDPSGLGLGYGRYLVRHFAGWLSLGRARSRSLPRRERRIRRPRRFHARYSCAQWKVLFVLSGDSRGLEASIDPSNRPGLGGRS